MQLWSVAFVVIPWLIPFNGGPTPVAVQWLFSLTCFSVFLLYNYQYKSDAVAFGWLTAAMVSVGIAFVQYLGVSENFVPWIASSTAGEVFGNLRQRNQYASLLSIGFCALLFLVRSLETKNIKSLTLTNGYGWIVCAFFLGLGNAISSSRTGALQAILIFLLALRWQLFRWRGIKWSLAAYWLAYVGATAMQFVIDSSGDGGHGIVGRFLQVDAYCTSRLTLWSNVLHLIAQKPWFGWGWGELDYAHFTTLYPGARFCDILDNAHNLPLHLVVELGVPLAAMVCGVLGWLVWRAKPWAETHPTRQLAWVVLAVIGLHSLLEYPLWYGPFQVTVVLCIWMLRTTPAQGQKIRPNSPRAPVFTAYAATILIAICAYAAWDYWRISQIYLTPERRSAFYRIDTLAKIQGSWLFKNQVKFAELTITELTPDNAERMYDLALDLLHFSPEPRVVQKLIESATLLGKDTEAVYYLQRFKAAFPADYQKWKK
jgi:O-antigen ligase